MNQHYGSDTWFTTCLKIEASSQTFGIFLCQRSFHIRVSRPGGEPDARTGKQGDWVEGWPSG
ncbi:MAG TPA: hypothetical protein GXZ26_08290 [Firmicutes bacterium]|nr:hypothetical protein [Bacillota bacterium]